jgi:predicted AAA+ superfamily ATPase
LEEKIIESLKKDKIIIIYGARQVGKTTLVKKFIKPERSLYLNGDFIDDAKRLDKPTKELVSRFVNVDLLIIDEAQNIKDIGLKLKVIHDTLPKLKIIATGSSSFELSNEFRLAIYLKISLILNT